MHVELLTVPLLYLWSYFCKEITTSRLESFDKAIEVLSYNIVVQLVHFAIAELLRVPSFRSRQAAQVKDDIAVLLK